MGVGFEVDFSTEWELKSIKKYSKLLDFGIVCFNEGSFSNPVAPFGGTKDSGFGREGGSYGLEEFLETKFTSIS